MDKEYLISFSSFYKASYAVDVLYEHGIKANLRKLPIEIANSCNTGLYIRRVAINEIKELLKEHNIVPRAVYEIVITSTGKRYQNV